MQNENCTSFGCREITYLETAEERLEISFDEPSGQQAATANIGGTNKLFAGALVTVLVVIALFGGYIIMGINEQAISPDPTKTDTGGPDQPDYPVFDDLNADYENGTVPIGDLPIGVRVVDHSWEWEYRLGVNYSNKGWDGDPTPAGKVKPVTWIVVAKDHYDGLKPHVTLLSEELIGLFAFDDSTERVHEYAEYGYNHWGDSGTVNASRGLRPWLNSTGIHLVEGFYRAFSESFKQAVLTTTLANKEWKNGSGYSTQDKVFLPSTTELGDTEHDWTYRIGNGYAYFSDVGDEERIAMMAGDGWYDLVDKSYGEEFMDDWGIYGNNWFYWTRSPGLELGCLVRYVGYAGGFYDYHASFVSLGVRPALNLKFGTLVSEIGN